MTSAREEMLTRIRTAIGTRDPVDVPRNYRGAGAPDADLNLFAERLRDYGATVQFVARADLPTAIAEICTKHQCRSLAVPEVLDATWIPPTVTAIRDSSVAALDLVDGTLTACAVAVAETGTIVLDHKPDQGPRAMTLIPDLHIVVVRADQVVARIPDALPRLTATRALTWISGPSATSDIELSRVEGVHGPRRLDVLIVADDVIDRVEPIRSVLRRTK